MDKWGGSPPVREFTAKDEARVKALEDRVTNLELALQLALRANEAMLKLIGEKLGL